MKARRLKLIALMTTLGTATVAAPAVTAHAASVVESETAGNDGIVLQEAGDGDIGEIEPGTGDGPGSVEEEPVGPEMTIDYGFVTLTANFTGTQEEFEQIFRELSESDAKNILSNLNIPDNKYFAAFKLEDPALIGKMKNARLTLNDTSAGKSIQVAFFDPMNGYKISTINANNPSMEIQSLPSYLVVTYDVALEKADYSKLEQLKDYLTSDRMQKFRNEDQMNIYQVMGNIQWDLTVKDQDTVDGYAKALQAAVNEALSHKADYSYIDALIAHIDYSLMSEETAQTLRIYLDGLDRTVCNEDYMAVMEYEVRFQIGDAYGIGLLADYEALYKALDLVPADLEYKYTAESREEVKKYLDQVTLNLPDWRQDEIDTLAGELNDAIKRLVKLPEGITMGDYTRLNELKSQYESLDPNNYTSISFDRLRNYMEAIKWNLTSENQAQIDAYAIDVEKIMDELVEVTDADFTELDKTITTVPSDLENYTKTSRENLKDALNALNDIYQLRSDQQEEIDGYVENLKNLISQLLLRADSTELDELLKKIPTNYKEILSDAMIEEIDYVLSSVSDYEDVTEEAVMQDYVKIVKNCIEKISYGDYSRVDEKINSIPADLSMYSDESVLDLMDYIANIDRSLLPEEQDIIDAYVDGIQEKLDALQYRKADFTLVDQALENVPPRYLDWFDNNEELLQLLLSIDRNLDITHQAEVDALADKIRTATEKLVLKQADYSGIQEAIAMVPEDLSGYSEESVFQLQDLLANITYGLTIDYQEQVDNTAQAIKDAIAALQVQKANYDALNAILEDVPENLNLYKNGKEIQKILDEIDYGLNVSQQAKIDYWTDLLTQELQKLEYKDGDYSGLDDVLARVPNDMERWYTADSIQKVYEAINSIIRGLDISQQDEIDAMTIAVLDSINQLEYLPADYTELKHTMTLVPEGFENLYTEESVNALKQILSEIEDGLNITQQATIDDWNASLLSAIQNLVMKGADYTDMKKLLATLPEEYEKYYDGADAVKDVIAKIDYSLGADKQEQVDQITAELREVMNQLTVKKADYSEWNQLVTQVPDDLSLYKNGNEIKQLMDSMDYTLDIFNQDMVSESTAKLKTMLKELSYKDADYTELKKVLETVPADLSIYLNTDHLKELLASVSYDKNITQQSEVDALTDNIRTEVEKLTLKAADYTRLQEVIDTIPTDYEDWYTESTVSEVKNTLASINWDLDITKQGEIDVYVEKLTAAIRSLQYKPADYSELEKVIASVPSDLSIYKDVSALKAALENVEYNLEITHQEKVDAVTADLKKALSELELKEADYGMIKNMIDSLPANMDELYTEDSVKAVQDVINSIPENLDILSQEVVNGYAEKLDEAIRSLVYKDADYSELDKILQAVPKDLNLYDNTQDLYKAIDSIVRGKNITQQDEVDAMAAAVRSGLAKISIKPADYSKLDEVLTTVPKDFSVYKESREVEKLLKEVDRNLSIREQEKVDTLAENIRNAVNKLEYRDADYSKLDEIMLLVPSSLSDYDNTEELEKALQMVVRDKNITQQDEVDAMTEAVKTALDKITLKSADYTKLDQVLGKIPADLTLYKDTAEIEELLKEVDHKLNIREQEIVDSLAKRLEEAVSKLEYKDADYKALRETVSQIPDETVLNLCTYESVKKVRDILTSVDWSLKIIAQDEVDAWTLALDNAIQSLTYLDADYTELDAVLKKIPADLSNYDNTEHLQSVLGNIKHNLDIRQQESIDTWCKELKQALSEITEKQDQNMYELKNESEKALNDEITSIIEAVAAGNYSGNAVSKDTQAKIKDSLDNGDSIRAVVKATEVKATDLSEDALKILQDKINSEKMGRISFLDISVLLTVNGTPIGNVTELENPLKLSLKIPKKYLKEGRTFYVIRYHDGDVELIKLENKDGYASFYSDKFSTYAFAYKEAEYSENTHDKKPDDTPAPKADDKTGNPKNNVTPSVEEMITTSQQTFTPAPKTDDMEVPVWAWASVVLSGAAIIITGKKRKTNKNLCHNDTN